MLLRIGCKTRYRLRLGCSLINLWFYKSPVQDICLLPAQTRVPRSSFSRNTPVHTPPQRLHRLPSLLPNLAPWYLGEPGFHFPGKWWRPGAACSLDSSQDPFRHLLKRRGAPPKNWGSPRSEQDWLGSPPPLSAQPLSRLSRGTREPVGTWAVPRSPGWRPRRSSHLSRRPKVSDAWEGRGRGGRGPGGRTRRGCAPGRCFWAPGAGQLAASSQSSSGKAPRPSRPLPAPSTRPPAPGPAARALGPPNGRRTRRRPRRTYRAGSPAPPARHPAAAAASTEQRAHTALGQIQRSRAQRRGPRRGSGVGLGEGGRWGEGREQQVLQLPSVPTARQRRARDAGGEGSARSANEFTFFFSPALSPSPFPPAPPASSLAAGCRGRARVFGSRPGSGRTETAREEAEGKVRRRAGRAAREQHPGPSAGGGGRAGRVCPSRARTRVRVCECGSEASRGAYHALPPPRGSRESPIPGRAGPAAIIYNPCLLHSATCQDDGHFISSLFLFKKRDFPFTAFFSQMGFAGLNHVRSPSLLPAAPVREGAEAPPLWPISASTTLAAI